MSVLPQPAVLDFPSPQKMGDKSAAKPAKSAPDKRTPIGEILVRSGALSPDDLLTALALRNREETRLGYILTNHDMVSEADLYSALSEQFQADLVDLQAEPPLPRLSELIDMEYCIRENIILWRDLGGAIIIATSRPDQFERVRSEFPPQLGTVLMAIAPEQDIQNALASVFRDKLVEQAETCVAEQESCRLWNTGRMFRLSLLALLGFATFAILYPSATFTALCIAAIFILMVNMGLKAITTASQIGPHLRRNRGTLPPPASTTTFRLPVVSIMVPLFREREVASHLIRRLKRLNYPKELLDICLVVEEDDDTTNETLSHTQLPRWARVIRVPTGNVRTKPRAMNYALKFCRGSIIGVYDAEDAPHPDQIHQIVRRFHERGPQVACLQGLLDFYNPRTNWLSRCFTIEYNTWFRLFLPGLEKLGFAFPLGGTTLFFRREALEKLGGWDAHNVTEDADLGIRLARHGLRTEIVHTVTEEEANCRFVPWVKQRSRWLKGFAITWAVHMRAPGQTLRELGLKKFIGMQILFIGTFSHFLLAPLLWSFWLILFGVHHPILDVVNSTVMTGLTAMFLLSEIITIAVGCFAISDRKHRFLMGWTPTMHFYFPMGTLAAYKALYELVTQPFYWDKTAHGIFERTEELAPEA